MGMEYAFYLNLRFKMHEQEIKTRSITLDNIYVFINFPCSGLWELV